MNPPPKLLHITRYAICFCHKMYQWCLMLVTGDYQVPKVLTDNLTIAHVSAQNFFRIIFQYQPISLQRSWLNSQSDSEWLLYEHHREFSIRKKIIPMFYGEQEYCNICKIKLSHHFSQSTEFGISLHIRIRYMCIMCYKPSIIIIFVNLNVKDSSKRICIVRFAVRISLDKYVRILLAVFK